MRQLTVDPFEASAIAIGCLLAEWRGEQPPPEEPRERPVWDKEKREPAPDESTGELKGVTLYDIALFIQDDDVEASKSVRCWINSKKIKAEPIAKCPRDGRRQLYRLSEILSDVKEILSLDAKEVSKYRQALASKLRAPTE